LLKNIYSGEEVAPLPVSMRKHINKDTTKQKHFLRLLGERTG